jgi:hypothetical protein
MTDQVAIASVLSLQPTVDAFESQLLQSVHAQKLLRQKIEDVITGSVFESLLLS